MAVNIEIVDEREQKDNPPVDAEAFKVQAVLDFADIQVAEDEELTIQVVLHNGQQDGKKRTPSTVLAHGHKKELYEVELKDAKTGEEFKIWQERDVVDPSTWVINVLILPKPELHYKSMRAISRAVAREVFAISAYRAYGDMMAAIYPSPKEFMEAQTAFADNAPWVIS